MKKLTRTILISAATGLIWGALSSVIAQAQVILAPGFNPDPKPITTGTSGGGKNSGDCGSISAAPNLQLQLTEQFTYLRFSVQGAGQPTLLIEGPTGRFCGLAQPEISGLWIPGTYNIYVGDRAGGQHPFSLSVTKNP
ncbi:hypothetical protein NG798_16825 [Ancylothrix sp. C2]|uniref:hypothetical protein n=1 Tax=Ancylothrix sp. D3o TaxID=2953691 RepID=UPI0021BAB377|nr:hypothetical protein [Ancylothrix sp. D3o]MCT7951468.1 hypothetical protein [Ancylothrix sp. D3o]